MQGEVLEDGERAKQGDQGGEANWQGVAQPQGEDEEDGAVNSPQDVGARVRT